MKSFNITPEDRQALVPIHRAFQAGVCTLANLKMGLTPPFRIDGIFKYEGGVVVNGKEIAIKGTYLKDDFAPTGPEPSPEETATLDAMLELIERVKGGDNLSDYDVGISGNHLVSFFECVAKV